MTTPIALVSKPTAAEEVRTSVIDVLRETLAQAEAGEIDSVAMILGHPDDTWSDRYSGVLNFSSVIGRIEILKLKWIRQHTEYNGE